MARLAHPLPDPQYKYFNLTKDKKINALVNRPAVGFKLAGLRFDGGLSVVDRQRRPLTQEIFQFVQNDEVGAGQGFTGGS